MKYCLFLLLFLVNLAAAEILEKLVVTSSGSKPTIAFLPFQNNSGVPIPPEYLPETIIASDLNMSSRFRTIQSQEIDSAYWNAENVVAYVSGYYSKNVEGKLVIECRLNDFITFELIFGNVYTLAQKDIRKNMHNFSDQIVKAYYKRLGVASTSLAFVNKEKGKKELVVSDYDGFNKQFVTSDGQLNTMPEWSSDNFSLYYVSFKKYQGKVFKKNIFTGEIEEVIKGIDQSFVPRLSPDGKGLLFTRSHQGNSDIYYMDLATGKKEQLTNHWAIETSAAWAPDGTQFVFSSDRGGMPQLYIAKRDGTDIKRLTFEGKYNDCPRWAPNGKKILYCGMSANGRFNIFTIDVETKEIQQLTHDEGNNESPDWSPDGQLITFSSTRTGMSQIYIMAADGSGVTQVTKRGENTSPTWSHYKTIQQ